MTQSNTNFLNLQGECLDTVVSLLSQQDILHLILVCYDLYLVGTKKLYKRICVRDGVILERPKSHSFISASWTVISGFNNVLASTKANDELTLLRIEVLMSSLEINPHLIEHIEQISVLGKINEKTRHAVSSIVDLVLSQDTHNLNRLQLEDIALRNKYAASVQKISSLTNYSIGNLLQLSAFPQYITQLHIGPMLDQSGPTSETDFYSGLSHLKSLSLSDEHSSYQFFKSLFRSIGDFSGVKKLQLETLKVRYSDNDTILQRYTVDFVTSFVDLTQLKSLEIEIGCCSSFECSCMDDFLDEMVGELTHLKKLSLVEIGYVKNHKISEKWDVSLLRFAINIPSELKYLSIHHAAPLDGKYIDGVEGNFIRRKKLYQHALEKLPYLDVLIAPTFMASCACYEQVMSDLLWNGCKCDFCAKMLSVIDTYIMNHQYYDKDDADFKDIISCRFFAAAGDSVSKRLSGEGLNYLEYPAKLTSWNFHGYSDFTCMNGFDCAFNQSEFQSLIVIMSHFMETYVREIMKLIPNLKLVVLSGVYFELSKELNGTRKFRNVYDYI